MEESPFIVWRMRSDPKLVRFRLGRTHSLRLSWFSFSLPGRPRRVMASFLSSVALGRQGKYKPMPSAWFACGSLSFLSSPRLCVVDPLSPWSYLATVSPPTVQYVRILHDSPVFLAISPFPHQNSYPRYLLRGGRREQLRSPFASSSVIPRRGLNRVL